MTVLSPFSETTTPSRIRLGISLSSGGRGGLAAQHGFDAGDVLADLAGAVGLLQLTGGRLEAQVELLFLQRQQRVLQLVGGHLADFVDLHRAHSAAAWATPASSRVTILVRIGSLAAPSCSDRRATSSATPSISNRMRPGCTRGAQYSTAP